MPALRHTVIVIIALLVSVTVRAQDDWDSVLDRYEEICSRCIELRERITAGEAVPNAEVTGLLGELSRLRTLIQDSRGRMSAAQRKRFNAIRNRYDTRTGNVKDAPPNKATEPRKERKTITAEPQVMDTVSIRNSYILPRGKKIAGLPQSRLPEYEERGIPAMELTAKHGTTIQKNTAYGSIRTDIIPIAELGFDFYDSLTNLPERFKDLNATWYTSRDELSIAADAIMSKLEELNELENRRNNA